MINWFKDCFHCFRAVTPVAKTLVPPLVFDFYGKEELVVHIATFLPREDRACFFVLNRKIHSILWRLMAPPAVLVGPVRLLTRPNNQCYIVEDLQEEMNDGMRKYGSDTFLNYDAWYVLDLDTLPCVNTRISVNHIRNRHLLRSYTFREATPPSWHLYSVTLSSRVVSNTWIVGFINGTMVAGRTCDGAVTLRRAYVTEDSLPSSYDDFICTDRIITVLLYKTTKIDSGVFIDPTRVTPMWRLVTHKNRMYIEDFRMTGRGPFRKCFNQTNWCVTEQVPGLFTMNQKPDLVLSLDIRDLVLAGRQCPYGSIATFKFLTSSVLVCSIEINADFENGTLLFGHTDQSLAHRVGDTIPFTPKVCGRVLNKRVRLLTSLDNGQIMDTFGTSLAVFDLKEDSFIKNETMWERNNIRLSQGDFTYPTLRIQLRVLQLHNP